MAFSKPSTSSARQPVPLIIPNSAAIPIPNISPSFNVFRMILNDGNRAKVSQPVIDLESEVLNGDAPKDVMESPVAKRQKKDLEGPAVSGSETPKDCANSRLRKSQGARNSSKLGESLESVFGDSVVDLTEEDVNEISLATRSQVEEDVIELSDESVSSCGATIEDDDDDEDVICMNDLTVVDEEVTILQDVENFKRLRRSRRRSDFISTVLFY
ncbi:hypothetical protein KIN20_032119 [Parelaphostrongylus tenuis]|uniref:Uncharacterized protein n=1 Tax=Parelaphostrongylus tenuis TaxID=148309 RepID=A0AAD5R661_PARTN|nr:hypothetical protein KIN20_032119 [Parelaphostrongylus tenuis]